MGHVIGVDGAMLSSKTPSTTPDYGEGVIDRSATFSQALCPSCFTAVQTAITPKGEEPTVSRFAMASKPWGI